MLSGSAPGTPAIDNLFAKIGSGRPHLVFAGHTDVVPPGNESRWSHPPFSGEIAGGKIYGRGTADMKGAIAAFAAAALDYVRQNKPKGTISLLITFPFHPFGDPQAFVQRMCDLALAGLTAQDVAPLTDPPTRC